MSLIACARAQDSPREKDDGDCSDLLSQPLARASSSLLVQLGCSLRTSVNSSILLRLLRHAACRRQAAERTHRAVRTVNTRRRSTKARACLSRSNLPTRLEAPSSPARGTSAIPYLFPFFSPIVFTDEKNTIFLSACHLRMTARDSNRTDGKEISSTDLIYR